MHLEWNKLKTPGYLEIGLAVILIITMAGIGGWKQHQNKVLEKEKEIIRQAEEENKKEKDKQQNANNKTESVSENDVQETIAEGQYPIMGTSPVTAEQLVSYFKSAGVSYPSEELGEGGADSIETFATMYCEEAAAEGVRPEVAFVQTMKETGWLQFGGDVSVEQFNFAGLGTTGGGVKGIAFPDVRTGIRAQVQHLKAYASTDSLNQECVDERFDYVTRETAPYVEWLGIQENPYGGGWAAGKDYGSKLRKILTDLKSGT